MFVVVVVYINISKYYLERPLDPVVLIQTKFSTDSAFALFALIPQKCSNEFVFTAHFSFYRCFVYLQMFYGA